MPTAHIGLPSTDLSAAQAFYTTLFGAAPDKVRDDYVRFTALDGGLVLSLNAVEACETPAMPQHFGVRVDDVDSVVRHADAMQAAGHTLLHEEATTCCWAVQTKFWAIDPDGHRWEVYTVHADADVADDTERTCCGPAPEPAADARCAGPVVETQGCCG